jgi:hypothetical protein
VSRGSVTGESLAVLGELSRPVNTTSDTVRLFATNLEADSYNVDKMLEVN